MLYILGCLDEKPENQHSCVSAPEFGVRSGLHREGGGRGSFVGCLRRFAKLPNILVYAAARVAYQILIRFIRIETNTAHVLASLNIEIENKAKQK